MSDNTPSGDAPQSQQPAPPPAYEPPPAPPAGSPADYPPAGISPPAQQQYPAASTYGQQPGYGAPPAYSQAGYPAAPAYGGGYPQRRTNSLAIVSLIAGIAGLTLVPFIGSIVGVITGHMSLSQLKTSGEEGRGIALGGLITGYVGIGLAVLGLLVALAFLPALFAVISNLPTNT
ncbi:DUF4190 domain-containing protein [Microbacterium immunditiarum]|uniref:DUF4190 domain-containing protein n=1 Tax=Microbacterium immunditiarum TaxID=337480 RepID=A0A7Y9KLZ8_9MICO|nr:DUF4190 domain-containing protein [Microbacterium immunditiarum]NYE20289.1 hypothetical protein [Microbacterium immunditiarum]